MQVVSLVEHSSDDVNYSGFRGRECSTKFSGMIRQGPTHHLFMYHFWEKRYTFHIPSWFRTLQIPLNCFKYTVFLVWINNHLFRKFCWLFHSHKKYLFVLLIPFTDWNDSFSYPLIYFNLWNLYPFMYGYDRPVIANEMHACKVEKRNMFTCILCLHCQHLCNLQGCILVITH